jgi:hypothetical protein
MLHITDFIKAKNKNVIRNSSQKPNNSASFKTVSASKKKPKKLYHNNQISNIFIHIH